MKIVFMLIIVSLSHDTISQNKPIQSFYDQIFTIKKQKFRSRAFLTKQVVMLDDGQPYAKLINHNQLYIDYLLTHFSASSNYAELLKIEDSVQLQNQFIEGLKHDTLFNGVMNKLVDSHVGTQLKDTITMDDLLNIAVKFFSVTKINEEGHYVGKVCTGINGLKETEVVRRPQLEAFCFSVIIENYEGEIYHMLNEFVKALKKLYLINLGIDSSDRLLRAQGALYMLMRENETLKMALMSAYEEQQFFLPFILHDEGQ